MMLFIISAGLSVIGGFVALGLGLLYDNTTNLILAGVLFVLCAALGVWWLVMTLEDVPDLLRAINHKLDK